MFRSAYVRYSGSRSAWKSLSIRPQPQLAVLVLKLVTVFLSLNYGDMPPLWAPLPDHYICSMYQWGDRGVLGGTWVLVEVVGGGSDPFSHFTPFVRANSSYNSNFIELFGNFIRQTVERPNPDKK